MKKNKLFWISFSDIMSCLFYIMLVLFVVTFFNLKKKSNELNTLKDEKQKIQEIRMATRNLDEKYFNYQLEHKRYKLNRQIQFSVGKCNLNPKDYDYLIEVGSVIEKTTDSLRITNKDLDLNVKYLLVIEGMSSKDSFNKNYELSYCRAKSIHDFWLSNGIEFDSDIYEVQISGSGIGGIRDYSGLEEYKNQQVLIHIIPKW